jgi:pimeloyl-ACP methyl ester carboxylesterase
MRRNVLAAATAAVLTSVLAVPTAGWAHRTTGSLSWGACPPALIERDPRQECATLPVPLDHRSPGGRTIDLVVSRIATAQPGLRRGVLVVNTGGPGDIGVDAPSFYTPLMPRELTDRFDLVSFDPRGVGYSAPISCHFADATPEVSQRYPDVDGSIDRNVAYARDLAQRCATNGGDVLPFVTTANTARDMDLVRTALGERRISYLGYSYGSYLGAVYRTMFPHRADRFVLDSDYDPALSRYEQLRLTGLGAALRLPDFTRWAAARDDRYHLGATAAAVRSTYDTLTARLDATPLTLPDGTVVTGNLLRIATFEGLYRDANFPGLAETWQLLAGARAATGVTRLAAAIPADNQPSVQVAIHCNDDPWPRDVATYRRNVALDRRLFPRTAGFPANIWACAFWPHKQIEPAIRVRGNGARTVLIVQNLRDPATPWIGALGMQRALGSDAALLSVDQGGHTAYLTTASACANEATTAFLTRGVLPSGPRICPGQPLPA